jgi:hypothetical protein
MCVHVSVCLHTVAPVLAKFSMMAGTLLEEVSSTSTPTPLSSHIPKNVLKTLLITKEPFVLTY